LSTDLARPITRWGVLGTVPVVVGTLGIAVVVPFHVAMIFNSFIGDGGDAFGRDAEQVAPVDRLDDERAGLLRARVEVGLVGVEQRLERRRRGRGFRPGAGPGLPVRPCRPRR
jgi:hypothetical protein